MVVSKDKDQVLLNIDKKLVAKIDEKAKKEKRSRTQMIVILIERALLKC